MKSASWIAPGPGGVPPNRLRLSQFSPFQMAIRCYERGRFREAEELFRSQLRMMPDHPDTLECLALIRIQAGDREEAKRLLRRLFKKNRGSASAYNNLGTLLLGENRFREAIAVYRQVLAVEPGFVKAINNLGNALLGEKRYDEAIAQFEKALVLAPDFMEAYWNLGSTLFTLNRCDEGIACYDRALAVTPNDPNAHFQKGVALVTAGRMDDARLCFENMVELAPRNVHFHAALADAKRYRPGDPQIRQLEELARDIAALPEEEQMILRFTLAKVYTETGQGARAIPHMIDANAIKRRSVGYNEAATLREFDRIRTVFTPELMAAKAGAGNPSDVPIFVLGMPRSGTTLIEQILASHPLVFGAGELSHFDDAVAKIRVRGRTAAFPDDVAIFGGAELRSLGTKYIEMLVASAAPAERITDKLPANFKFVGLIHLALPNAKIIHCRRDPIDTCLSCFSRQFAGEMAFTYDLAELGRYYRAYQKLMEHWRQVLPAGAMLEVNYEEVVADLEEQARRLVAYCGLEWDPACLAFHETQRPIRTASVTQVRQPLYRSSVGRWDEFRHLLTPLLEALEIEPAGL